MTERLPGRVASFDPTQLAFVIGAPRSGTTLLMRILNAHDEVLARPEPHLMTPLARLGFYGRVDHAPYDTVQSAQAIRAYVDDLPGGESDYLDALRAYTDVLYGRMLAASGQRLLVDKTPAYALELPFITSVYPTAHYIVLLRHPFAIFASYAASFFHDDWDAAHAHNPVLERYLPALATYLRAGVGEPHVVRYESLVADPEAHVFDLCDHLGLSRQASMVDYQRKDVGAGLGDPIGVAQHQRPTTASVDRWALAVKGRPDRIDLLKRAIDRVSDADLMTLGFDRDRLWIPVESVSTAEAERARSKAKRWDRYRLERWVLTRTRTWLRQSRVRPWVQTAKTVAEVLTRPGWPLDADERGRP